MPAPAFVSATAHAGNPTTSATVTLPTTAANDILIVLANNGGANAAPTMTTGTFAPTLTSIDSGGWTSGWGGVWWARCTGDHTGQTIIASGATDSASLQVVRFSGCATSGNPYDTNISGGTVAAGANATLAAFTTTVADTLVVLCCSIDDNLAISAPTKNAVAMNNLNAASSTGGADSGVASASLAQAVAGTTGSFAITVLAGTNQGKRMSGFALVPPTAGAVDLPLDTSAALSAATIALTALTQVALAASGAVASPTLALKAPTQIPLSTSTAQGAATFTLTAPTQIPLGVSAAQSTSTGALSATTRIPLAASAALANATLAVSTPGSSTSTTVARVSLAPGSPPATRTLHSIKVRARKTSGAGTVNFRAALYESSTNISGNLTTGALTASLAGYTLAIADADAANITSYGDLEIRFWGESPTGDTVNVEVADIWLEVPAATGAFLLLDPSSGLSAAFLALETPPPAPPGVSPVSNRPTTLVLFERQTLLVLDGD